MSTGIGCTVYVDGVRVADGAPSDDPLAPTVLSGLAIAWGRDTTVDQPESSTCSLELMDELGGSSFLGSFHTGARVDVVATGTLYPDPTEPVWPDPGFETGLPGVTAVNGTVTRTDVASSSGTYALELLPRVAARRASVVVAPAPFAAPGTDPGAWDAIPTTSTGQTWTVGASVRPPLGAVAHLRPVLFTGPYASSGVVLAAPELVVVGDGSWHAVSAELAPGVDGAWVGLELAVYPTGPAWDELPDDLTWDAVDPSWAWDDLGRTLLDDVLVLAPGEGVSSSVLVYSGRVVSLTSSWDDGPDAPLVSVECVDFLADLENIAVGEEPWTVEPMGTRFTRILELAGLDVTAELDATVSAVPVTWRDVDRQPAAGLLAELAESVDAVMWSAVHAVTGPYLRVEDPTNRPSAYLLELADGVIVIVPGIAGTGLELSACDVLRDDVEWTQDVADVVTRAAVTWQEQGTDDDGAPTTTDRTVTLVDAQLEARLGARGLSLSTQLQAETDAELVAEKLLARTRLEDWRASSLTVDDALNDGSAEPDVDRLLTLLDGTTRNGLALRLTDLPAWAPVGVNVGLYLEGGTYTFADGAWVLELTVSNATAQGASAQWDDLDPSWQWDQFDPAITWDDLRGVGINPA